MWWSGDRTGVAEWGQDRRGGVWWESRFRSQDFGLCLVMGTAVSNFGQALKRKRVTCL